MRVVYVTALFQIAHLLIVSFSKQWFYCFLCCFSTLVIRKTLSCDSNKPLIIPAGSDSFSQIGENSATLWPKSTMHLIWIKSQYWEMLWNIHHLALIFIDVNRIVIYCSSYLRVSSYYWYGNFYSACQEPKGPLEESLWACLPGRGGSSAGGNVCLLSAKCNPFNPNV